MDAENKKPGGLRKSSLVQAWLVLVLAVGFGVSLAGVQLALGPVIESNKINETLEKVPELVLGNFLAAKMATENQTLEIVPRQVTVKKSDRAKFYSVYEARYQDGLKGWVVKTKGQGYADTIELLLGLSPDLRTITGLFVLDQKETPGLGNKIITDAWRGQFIDAPADKPLIVVKTGASRPGEIDAVTGATISSRSVTAMINTAIGDLRKPLTAGPSAAGKGGKNNG
ncbi:MAG: FMN-binding protein [Desulfosarcina sp.]|nr:FMN-binding protein [Desulfosarcina sp.]MBC2766660.1 FMN-binding protein [Desulfosarcina sp.]